MTHRILAAWLVGVMMLVVGCGRRPAPEGGNPSEAGAPALMLDAPDDTGGEVAAVPDEVTYTDITTTEGGEVAFSEAQHVLRVTHGDKVEVYRTGVLKPDLSVAEQAELVANVASALRYPSDRVTAISGTYVREDLRRGNELVALTYTTADSVDTVDALYRDRLSNAGIVTHRVSTPFGDGRVVAYHVGMGEERYRVVAMPEGTGSRIEVTQTLTNGAVTQEWDGGQGVVRATAAATTEPVVEPPVEPAADLTDDA